MGPQIQFAWKIQRFLIKVEIKGLSCVGASCHPHTSEGGRIFFTKEASSIIGGIWRFFRKRYSMGIVRSRNQFGRGQQAKLCYFLLIEEVHLYGFG